MVPAPPRAAFEVIQPQLVLEFLITVLDPPAALGSADQHLQARRCRLIAEEELGGTRGDLAETELRDSERTGKPVRGDAAERPRDLPITEPQRLRVS